MTNVTTDGQWVIDTQITDKESADAGLFAFCPLDGDSVIVGMTFVSDLPPGELVGFFHPDGENAVQEWMKANDEAIQLLSGRIKKRQLGETHDDAAA